MTLSRICSVALVALAFTTITYAAKNPMVGGKEMFPNKNIIENAVNSADHTTLVAAVKAAGLVETLQGTGPFTVFAPTNAAFAKLPAGTVDTLLKPENKGMLTKVLTYHVVGAQVLAADIPFGTPVATVSGQEITINAGTPPTITDTTATPASIVATDVRASNGVIHVVGKVLIPTL